MRLRFLLITLAALSMTACAVDASLDDADSTAGEADDSAPAADSPYLYPAGTFRADLGAAPFTLLVLKSDRTFHAENQVLCVRAPCPPLANDGTYRFTRRTSHKYIRFTTTDGEELGRYEYYYRLGDDNIELRLIGETERQSMQYQSDAWCDVPDDCGLQMLARPRCIGDWTCDSNVCAYACGEPMEDECSAAGGSCTGLRPGACGSGIHAPLSCGGGLGVTCCMPAPVAPVCDAVGSRSEGWYRADTHELICWANCAGLEATCGAIGSRSEGWYTDAGHGCIGGGGLIGWDNCAE